MDTLLNVCISVNVWLRHDVFNYPLTPPLSHEIAITESQPVEEVTSKEPGSQSHDNIMVTKAPSARDPIPPSRDSVAANIQSDIVSSKVTSGQMTTTEIHRSSGTTSLLTSMNMSMFVVNFPCMHIIVYV